LASATANPLNDRQVRALLVASRETHADELDCDEFLAHMAQYAEARAAGRAIPDALVKVEAHDRLCANCAEECAALIELVRAQQAGAG
jgi:hypothetical protein